MTGCLRADRHRWSRLAPSRSCHGPSAIFVDFFPELILKADTRLVASNDNRALGVPRMVGQLHMNCTISYNPHVRRRFRSCGGYVLPLGDTAASPAVNS